MAIKNNAAYQQLGRLPDTYTEDVKYWNNQKIVSENQQIRKDEIDYQRQKDRDSDKKAMYNKYVKPLNNFDTGSQSLNEVQGRLLQQATELYVPLLNTIEDSNISQEEKIKARIKLENLGQLPERLKEFSDFHKNQWESYKQLIGEGKIYPDENYEKAFSKGFENIQLGLNDLAMPVVAFVDKNGDGISDKPSEGDVLDFQTYDQIKEGIPTFNFQKKFNFEDAFKRFSTELGTEETVDEKGFKKRTIKSIRLDDLDFRTNKLFSEPSVIKSALRDYGITEATNENIEKIKQDFKKEVLARVDRLEKNEIDYTAINQARDDARANKKLEENKDSNIKSTEYVEIEKDTWGSGYYNNINREKVVSKSGNGIILEAPKDNNKKVYDNAKVLNYTFDKFGSLLLDVEYKDESVTNTKKLGEYEGESINTKVDKPVKRKVIQVTKTDTRDFAAKMGMTVEELKSSVQKNSSMDQPEKKDPLDPANIF